MHRLCREFKLEFHDIKSENLSFKVLSRGSYNEDLHSELKVSRPLSRTSRQKAKEILKHESPSSIRYKAINQASSTLKSRTALNFGNLGDIKSIDVLYKAKQEAIE